MSSNGTSSKKPASKKTTAPPSAPQAGATKKTTPQQEPGTSRPHRQTAVPATEQATATQTRDTAADENTVIKNFLAMRRRRRQLLALKITCYVLASAAATFIGLTIWQLSVPSPMAAAYAALAGVFVTATGVGCTVHHFIHRNNI